MRANFPVFADLWKRRPSELTGPRETIHPSAFILHPCVHAPAAPVERKIFFDENYKGWYARGTTHESFTGAR
jgi:hypothetical protein